MATQPFLLPTTETWIRVRDGNPTGLALYQRHYSRHVYKDGRNPGLFCGPGQKIVLLTPDARALFVWRKFISRRIEPGVSCAVFRNEGAGISSELIRSADAIAFEVWPGERHYTYVNPFKVEHKRQPGRCFLKAGWKYVKDSEGQRVTTTKGLYILELNLT